MKNLNNKMKLRYKQKKRAYISSYKRKMNNF